MNLAGQKSKMLIEFHTRSIRLVFLNVATVLAYLKRDQVSQWINKLYIFIIISIALFHNILNRYTTKFLFSFFAHVLLFRFKTSVTKINQKGRFITQTCPSNWLYNTCCSGCGYVFNENLELGQAVSDHLKDGYVGLNTYGAINCWDVSRITSMKELFSWSDFNENIGCWDVSNVEDMSLMFYGAKQFNQASIGDWTVSRVTNMNAMFSDASSFDQFIGDWDVSHVKSMSLMFARATAYNKPLDTWNVSEVVGLTEMFIGASAFNQTLNGWDVGNVLYQDCVFSGAASFDLHSCSWCGDITDDDCRVRSSNGTLF